MTYSIAYATEKQYCESIRKHSRIQDRKLVPFQDWLRKKEQAQDIDLEKAKEIAKRLQDLSLVQEKKGKDPGTGAVLVDTGGSVRVIGKEVLPVGTKVHRTDGKTRGADGKEFTAWNSTAGSRMAWPGRAEDMWLYGDSRCTGDCTTRRLTQWECTASRC